jgi:uridine phosphorylase
MELICNASAGYVRHCDVHTQFRGFKVWIATTFEDEQITIVNSGLGGQAMAFIMEELAAFGVRVAVNLGTGDLPHLSDPTRCSIMSSYEGCVGLMRDYGFPESEWGRRFDADPIVTATLQSYAAADPNVTLQVEHGYDVSAFYSFFDPANVAYNVSAVKGLLADYQRTGASMRDMESAALYLVGFMRGIRVGAVEQAVDKSNLQPGQHANIGTVGIPFTLRALAELAKIEREADEAASSQASK